MACEAGADGAGAGGRGPALGWHPSRYTVDISLHPCTDDLQFRGVSASATVMSNKHWDWVCGGELTYRLAWFLKRPALPGALDDSRDDDDDDDNDAAEANADEVVSRCKIIKCGQVVLSL